MNTNNNYNNRGSLPEDPDERAKFIAEAFNRPVVKEKKRSKQKSVIFGIIATITGLLWLILILLIYVMAILSGESDLSGFGAAAFLLPFILLPAGIISFIASLIAVFNEVNIVSSCGFLSALSLQIPIVAMMFFRKHSVLGMGLLVLLAIIFLIYLKRKQKHINY